MGDKNALLSRLVYRGILRWVKEHSDVPFSIQQTHVNAVLPELKGVKMNLHDASAVRYLARYGFESASSDGMPGRVDRGLDALRLLNTHYHRLVEEMRRTRQEKSQIVDTVKYKIGQVFRHKKYGYKGIIYGFDETCQRDEEWMRQMGVRNPDMPFYYALPDEMDSTRFFGGFRLSKYVAEENIAALDDGKVVHRALENFFIGYSKDMKRYVPTKRLQFEYPDEEYERMMTEMVPVADNANLLLYDDDGESSDDNADANTKEER